MRPEVGRSSPPRRLSSVDLPDPDFPSRATFSPRRTSSETPRRPQTRRDLPDVHSLVTSHNRTAGERVAADGGAGEKRDIGGTSLVGYPLSIRPVRGQVFFAVATGGSPVVLRRSDGRLACRPVVTTGGSPVVFAEGDSRAGRPYG